MRTANRTLRTAIPAERTLRTPRTAIFETTTALTTVNAVVFLRMHEDGEDGSPRTTFIEDGRTPRTQNKDAKQRLGRK